MFLQEGIFEIPSAHEKVVGAALATPLTRCRANRNALAWASGMYRRARDGRVRKLRAVGDHLARPRRATHPRQNSSLEYRGS